MPVYAAIKESPEVVAAELPCLTKNYGFLEAAERFRIMSNISIFFGVVCSRVNYCSLLTWRGVSLEGAMLIASECMQYSTLLPNNNRTFDASIGRTANWCFVFGGHGRRHVIFQSALRSTIVDL